MKKIIFTITILIFSLVILTQTKQDEKVLRVGIDIEVNNIIPYGHGQSLNVKTKILWNLLEPLVSFEEKRTKIQPYLATSWKASNNNRTWTIKLREGVKFHDGSILNADDVVASASLFTRFPATAKKISRLTVQFSLTEPYNGFLYELALPGNGITPAYKVKEFKKLRDENKLDEFIPIGTGPYKLSHIEKGGNIILEFFKEYWQGPLAVEKIIYQVIPDAKERLSALEKEEIDLIDLIIPEDIPKIRKKKNLRIINTYGMNICLLDINTTRKGFDNIRVRQALNLAVDKLRLARMFYYGGYGVPTNRITSPAFWGLSVLPTPSVYNPTNAKVILAEAGFKTDITRKLVCIPFPRPYLPNPKGMTEEIKRQLALVGMKLKIIIPSNYDEFFSILEKGDFDLALEGWIYYQGDPTEMLKSLLNDEDPTTNVSRWHNKEFEKKLMEARRIPYGNMVRRIRLSNEAQKIYLEEVPVIPLIHNKIIVIHNRKVKGIIVYPNSMISYHKLKIEN